MTNRTKREADERTVAVELTEYEVQVLAVAVRNAVLTRALSLSGGEAVPRILGKLVAAEEAHGS
jgi:hypothetical protein